MDFKLLLANTSGGEFSPLLHSRSDLQAYFSGVALMQDFLPLPQGGCTRRPGTYFCEQAKENNVLLAPFFVSRDSKYIIEFGNFYFRVLDCDTNLYVEVAGAPIEVATPYSTSELGALRWAQSVDVMFLAHPNHAPRSISRLSATSFSLATEDFVDGPYLDLEKDSVVTVSGQTATIRLKSTAADFSAGTVGKHVEYSYGGKIVIAEVTGFISSTEVEARPYDDLVVDPYEEDESTKITFAAAIAPYDERLRSTIAVWQRKHEYRYVRLSTGSWYKTDRRYSAFESVGSSGAAAAYSADCIKINPTTALTLETITGQVTWSNRVISSTLTCSVDKFVSSDVGRGIRVNVGGAHNWGKITAYGGARSVTVQWERIFPPMKADGTLVAKGQTDNWRLGAWYVGNYPSQISFHQGRLCFAASALEPNATWMSKTDDYTDFGPTDEEGKVLDTNGMRIIMNSSEFGIIRWMASHQTSLLIGGETHLWRIHHTGNSPTLTPTTVIASEEAEIRSGPGLVARSGDNVVFIGNGTVNSTFYEFDINGYAAKNLTIKSEHIPRALGSIIRLVCQALDHDRVWALGSNGTLACLLFNPDEEQAGWSRHRLSGACSSVAAIDDEVYFAVARPWGTTIERLGEVALASKMDGQSTSYPYTPLGNGGWNYMDCTDTHIGVNLNSVTLREGHSAPGQVVHVVADGSSRGYVAVASGRVVAFGGAPADTVMVGKVYESNLVTLPTDVSIQGTGQSMAVATRHVIIRVKDSYGVEAGALGGTLDYHSMRDSDDPMDSVTLKSGDYPMVLPSGFDSKGQIHIRKNDPYPLTIVGLVVVGDQHSKMAAGRFSATPKI